MTEQKIASRTQEKVEMPELGGVLGLYTERIPMNFNGYDIATERTFRIRRDSWSPVDHLPIDVVPGKTEEVRSLMQEEIVRAKALAGIAPNTRWQTEDQRQKMLSILEKTRKTGILLNRVDSRDGKSTLVVDAYPVPYAFYRHLTSSEDAKKSRNLGKLFATGVVLLTQDNMIVLQYRDPKGNAIYGGMLGTSTGGLYDSSFHPDKKGSVAPVTTKTVKEVAKDELNWEIGVKNIPDEKLRILSVVDDEKRVHTEAIIFAETEMTFEELTTNAKIMAKRPSPRPGHEFAENIVGVPATPTTIELILSDLPCPMPPTHVACLVAVGTMLVLQKTGNREEAFQWKRRLEGKIGENYKRIDTIVHDFWNTHSGEKALYKGDPTQYDPRFPAEVQGLSNAIDEMRRKGVSVLS